MGFRKRVASAAALMAVALTMSVAAPANAIVVESDSALRQLHPPVMDVCVSGTGDGAQSNTSRGCFKKYGDRIFSYDRFADGMSVYVDWENQLKDSSGNWKAYRKGRCTSTLGAEKYGECNKDFYENSTSPNAKGGKGSRIRIKSCTNIKYLPDDCTNWSSWITNNA